MLNYGLLVVDSLESMRNEYISTILHTALKIARDNTGKEFSMRPEYEVIGDERCGRVYYAIKEAENLLCVTEDKVQSNILEGFAQNIKQLESEISQASELPIAIEFTRGLWTKVPTLTNHCAVL
ncbi:7846_t:CDS:2 [Ambispora leptoticha]|uniref:7846_t:CDS:1 n=1 Tax=Ambispora leptoticha TaxID=144679 RepID=A0A9N9CGH4_9GLOM|nr:7846_t:CDS:2 [Ambispora leptoticha]